MLPAESSRKSRPPLQHPLRHISAPPFTTDAKIPGRSSRFTSIRRRLKPRKQTNVPASLGRSNPWDKQDSCSDDDSTALSSDYEGSIDTLESKRDRNGFSFEKIHSVRSIPRCSPPSSRVVSPSPPKQETVLERKNALLPPHQQQPPITLPLRQPLVLQEPSPRPPIHRGGASYESPTRSRAPLLSPRGPLSRRPPLSSEGPNAPTPKKSNTALGYSNRFLVGESPSPRRKNKMTSLARSTYEVDAPSTPPVGKRTVSVQSIRLDAQFEQDSWQNNMPTTGRKSNRMAEEEAEDEETRTLRTLEGTVKKLRAEVSANRRGALRPHHTSSNNTHVEELIYKTEQRLASYKARINYNRVRTHSFEYSEDDSRHHYLQSARVVTSPTRKSQSSRQVVSVPASDAGLTEFFSWSKKPVTKSSRSKTKRRSSARRKRAPARQAPIWREAPIWSEDDNDNNSIVSFAGEAPMWTSDENDSCKSLNVSREAPMWSPTASKESKPSTREYQQETPEKDYRTFFAQLSATFSDDLAVASVETPPSDKDYLHFFAHLTQSRDALIFQYSRLSKDESWESNDSPLPPSIESSVSSDDESVESIEPVQFSASLEESLRSESVAPTTKGASKASKRSVLRWSERFTQYTY